MIRVDKKSLADIQKAIVQIKQKSAKELSTELASTAAMIARDAQKVVPRDTGNLKKSIGCEAYVSGIPKSFNQRNVTPRPVPKSMYGA